MIQTLRLPLKSGDVIVVTGFALSFVKVVVRPLVEHGGWPL